MFLKSRQKTLHEIAVTDIAEATRVFAQLRVEIEKLKTATYDANKAADRLRISTNELNRTLWKIAEARRQQ